MAEAVRAEAPTAEITEAPAGTPILRNRREEKRPAVETVRVRVRAEEKVPTSENIRLQSQGKEA